MSARIRYAILNRLADFILRQLYPFRSAILTKQRLGTITPEQRQTLAQVEAWINTWELRTIPPRCGKPMLQELYSELGQIAVKLKAPILVERSPWRCGLPSWHKGECGAPHVAESARREERPN